MTALEFPAPASDTTIAMNSHNEPAGKSGGEGKSVAVSIPGKDGIAISWNDLSFALATPELEKKSKVEQNADQPKMQKIINEAYGVVRPGEMLAIMGPSGAGKSTILDLIAGRVTGAGVTGDIVVSGPNRQIKAISAYVMQDDSLIGSLTVRENIRFAAELTLGDEITVEQREERVEKLISALGLSKCAGRRVGTPLFRGISGGEKRRTSIATQLIRLPPVIFLDEPTSGLDSAAGYMVMSHVKELAQQLGTVVLCTIHQPPSETFNLFDKLLLLASGHTIYFGDLAGGPAYFNSIGHPIPEFVNPADFYLSEINVDFKEPEEAKSIIAFLNKGWAASSQRVALVEECRELHAQYKSFWEGQQQATNNNELSYARTYLQQTMILCRRSMINARRNVHAYWFRVLMHIGLAIVMGSVWNKLGSNQKQISDRLAAHFFTPALFAFMSIAGMPSFLEERLVVQRERANRMYQVGAYTLANIMISIPFLALIAVSYSVVLYWWIGLQDHVSQFFTFLAFVFLILNIAESMMVLIGAVVPTFTVACTLAGFVNGFYMIIQGFFVPKKSIPKFWYGGHYINYLKYAFESLVKNDFKGLVFDCDPIDPMSSANAMIPSANATIPACFCQFQSTLNSECKISGEDVLKFYDYDSVNLMLWALIMIALYVAFRIGFYLVLRFRK